MTGRGILIAARTPLLFSSSYNLDLVTDFINTTDFKELRSERPELRGDSDLQVELTVDAGSGLPLLRSVTTDE